MISRLRAPRTFGEPRGLLLALERVASSPSDTGGLVRKAFGYCAEEEGRLLRAGRRAPNPAPIATPARVEQTARGMLSNQ